MNGATWAVSALVIQALVSTAPAEATPIIERADADAARIGQLLRCPVCQGMPIAESPSQMAQDMMSRIREMLAAGKSEQEILDYFVQSYGEWVLLEPKAEGLNLSLWILPAVALLLGALLTVRFVRRTANKWRQSEPTTVDAGEVDPYLQAIRDEVER